MKILLRSGKHQLDSVQLVYLTCAWVVVNSYDICFRMFAANFLDNTFTYDVVWQAAKWLDADDVRNTAVDQLHHLACQEPALTSLVSCGNDRGSHFCKITDISGRCKVAALLQCLVGSFAQPVNGFKT